ncbi:AMP-binding protein [Fertoebacter nigrum]|uniref:AMP-binding protein n=1 Tax=Fertoeibacter niger TaxID=2656921 RepID=A0A8X8H1H9_9RHOB|nr:AMP-binding protein [Fertoeibacter niger]NUB45446.1 AMP-binding protein [Fertoeibacter niger]
MLHQENLTIIGTRALYERISGEMAKTPRSTVFSAQEERVSHEGLIAMAALIRNRLPCPDPTAEETVAICAEKTPDCLAAILAVLSTGRAYAPLDPTHPDARLTGILADLRPAALVVDETTGPRLRDWAQAADVPLLQLSRAAPDAVAPHAPIAVSQQSLAAVLHTSGSTGKPKRVEIEASALHVFQEWVVDELGLCVDDCLLSHAPFAFDLSFLDIYAALMSGAGLALADAKTARSGAKLMAMMQRARVTIWHSAPSALKLIAESAGDTILPDLRCVLFAGEPMPARTLQKLFRIFPKARFLNIYGCTETNDTFCYEVPRQNTPDPLPLGRALPYVDYVLADADGAEIAGPGEGELWVRCPTMMRGYADPALTARATVWHQGKLYYRSGDQVRRDATGLVHFIGRNDTIVKLTGIRVDLNEVDAALLAHPGVDEALSFVTPSADGLALNAWVTTQHDLSSLDLRLHLTQRLPLAAIPRHYTISRMEVPKNSNGKACRRQMAQNGQSTLV